MEKALLQSNDGNSAFDDSFHVMAEWIHPFLDTRDVYNVSTVSKNQYLYTVEELRKRRIFKQDELIDSPLSFWNDIRRVKGITDMVNIKNFKLLEHVETDNAFNRSIEALYHVCPNHAFSLFINVYHSLVNLVTH